METTPEAQSTTHATPCRNVESLNKNKMPNSTLNGCDITKNGHLCPYIFQTHAFTLWTDPEPSTRSGPLAPSFDSQRPKNAYRACYTPQSLAATRAFLAATRKCLGCAARNQSHSFCQSLCFATCEVDLNYGLARGNCAQRNLRPVQEPNTGRDSSGRQKRFHKQRRQNHERDIT
jgi:hypothetical protein